MALSGREKATIFLSILGSEVSGRVLKYLPAEVGDLIAAGLNKLPSPSPQALSQIIDEFTGFAALPGAVEKESALESVAEPESAYVPPVTGREGLDSLFYAGPKKISYVLAHERPELMAFVLASFPLSQRAEIISFLPAEKHQIERLIKKVKSDILSDKIRDRLFKIITKRISNL